VTEGETFTNESLDPKLVNRRFHVR